MIVQVITQWLQEALVAARLELNEHDSAIGQREAILVIENQFGDYRILCQIKDDIIHFFMGGRKHKRFELCNPRCFEMIEAWLPTLPA